MRITKTTLMLFAVSALAFAACSKSSTHAVEPSTSNAAANPCAGNTAAANPCAGKAAANPCAANPCAGEAAANPCDGKKMAANPCAGTAAANPCAGASTITDEDMENAVVMMESIADVMDANKADCDKMATELTKIMDSSKELLAKMKASKDDASVKAKFEAKYKDRMGAMMGKMMGGMQKCATHEGVRNAMKPME